MQRAGDRLHQLTFRSLDRAPAAIRERARQAILDARYTWAEDPWGYATDPLEAARYQSLLSVCGPVADWALEVGCGTGHLSRSLIANGQATWVVGVDISKVAVERASRHLLQHPHGWRAQFHQLDITEQRPTWFGQRFDLIVCTDILYYLPTRGQLASAIQGLASWLAPGGRLVLGHPTARASQLHATPAGLDQLHYVNRLRTGSELDYQIDVLVRRPAS